MKTFIVTILFIWALAFAMCSQAAAQCVGGQCQPQIMAPQIGYQPQTTWQPQTAYRPRVTFEPVQVMRPQVTYQPVQITPMWTPRTYRTPLRNVFFGRGRMSYMTSPIQVQAPEAARQ